MFEALIFLASMLICLWFTDRLDQGTKRLERELKARKIPDFPPAPSGARDADFNKKADAFLSALEDFPQHVNKQPTAR